MRIWLIIMLLVTAAACGPALPDDVRQEMERLPERVGYVMDVKPILSDRCFKCHGPDNNTRVENIRFDTPEGIRASRKHIAKKILAEDPEERMPPPEANLTLTPKEKAVLIRWVNQGAEYAPHWAYEVPTRPDVPQPLVAHSAGLGGLGTGFEDWSSGDIDSFVLARITGAGFEPNRHATSETWLRRVTFTLTGLPPSEIEIGEFVEADSPEAREAVVDRLLDSQAYGERMATDWLDLARYADSHGYQDDGWRNMWPWRDWVISAFNRNMPYDDFVTWQLAGDLLPGATREQILATGFNRNHLQSQEGGIVLEEYRVDYVADRVNTLGKAFLGLTTECARCHDHKYDPISQEEYYGMFAFFNSVNEVGNIPYAGEASPTVLLVDPVSEARLAELHAEILRLEAAVDPADTAYDEDYQTWQESIDVGALERRGLVAHFPLDGFRQDEDMLRLDDLAAKDSSAYFWGDRDKVPHVVAGVVDSALVLRGDGWLDTGRHRFRFERSDPFSLELSVKLEGPGSVGPLMGKSGGLFNGNRGYLVVINEDRTLTVGLYHVLPNDAIELRTADSLRVGEWQKITLTYDGSSRAAGLNVYRDGEAMETQIIVDNLRQSILYTVDTNSKDSTNWGDPGNLRIGFTENNQPMLSGAAVDEFRIYGRALTPAEISGRPPQLEESRAYFVTTESARYRRLFAELTSLRAEENRILTRVPSVMVMADLAVPRETFRLERGAYDARAEVVQHQTPSTVLPFPEDAGRDRLGLAEWLFDDQHPLTARVAVNRLWQQVFGTGIVATPDNFGSQGALPTHPELLDWLAVEFRESGWDIKHMLRLMVLSSTFAQSSSVNGDARSQDPNNRLHARGPARRLSAEMMRDQALAASGLLVSLVGGPSVKPYQPDGLWAELATRNGTHYEADSGDSLFRRSMYTLWKRTVPPPMMITFDSSERNLCAVQRQSTSTPLQALVLMNDPQFFEAARVLGERMIREGGLSDTSRISLGFRLLTGRNPDQEELSVLERLRELELGRFRMEPEAARKLLATGDFPRDRSIDTAEAAAYAVIASTIMNFDGATTLR